MIVFICFVKQKMSSMKPEREAGEREGRRHDRVVLRTVKTLMIREA